MYRLIGGGELRAVDVAPRGSLKPKARVRADALQAYIEAQTSTGCKSLAVTGRRPTGA
ncbi:hypothetical protein Pmi06nite_80810 [Planotetraspora mira]|uniref:Uncharacterized protein n=1 Tax=Planotetraspora mira TaxID=58121 RepID=A0A8J3XBW1_9ACTN|nr:hypothetical protein [Planotetraspora mira]GII34639.1 hypothetical protein Pmi06nite_80810 [Planotetraspora mira]